jgi:hypothetical protein
MVEPPLLAWVWLQPPQTSRSKPPMAIGAGVVRPPPRHKLKKKNRWPLGVDEATLSQQGGPATLRFFKIIFTFLLF